MQDASQERGLHGVYAVIDFLERHQAAYEVIEHRDTFAATSEARAAGTPPERMAKTILLHDHDGFRIAVIPAAEHLDLHKARALLQASAHVRLASEEEIEREFPAFDAGAVPPFSALLGAPEVLDHRLLAHHRILCAGGDHRHTLEISPHEIKRLGNPLVGDLCVD
jgi:Ala-tRNA(Pro) deacylase